MVNLIRDLDVFTCKWFVSFDFDGRPQRSVMLQNMEIPWKCVAFISTFCRLNVYNFCIATEKHWDGNRFECVSSVQCSKTKLNQLRKKSLTNNNNNNMTKAVYYQLVQCRRLSLSSFRIVAFVFICIYFLFAPWRYENENECNHDNIELNREHEF